ncbi:MAG: hypothetical protein GY861_16710 [bacterium]|nr:hypothetical protein [bacterium]
MALTVAKGSYGISIVFDGSTPWDSTTDYPEGLLIESFEFKPTATDDIMIVRDTTASGRFLFHEKAATEYDSKIKLFPAEGSKKKFSPYIVGNEASSGTILIIELK